MAASQDCSEPIAEGKGEKGKEWTRIHIFNRKDTQHHDHPRFHCPKFACNFSFALVNFRDMTALPLHLACYTGLWLQAITFVYLSLSTILLVQLLHPSHRDLVIPLTIAQQLFDTSERLILGQ